MDFIFIGAILAFLGITSLLVLGCAKLEERK